MTGVRRYLYGWWMFLRAVRMARGKKHGAGRASWRAAFMVAACYRFIVDGQFCGQRRLYWCRLHWWSR